MTFAYIMASQGTSRWELSSDLHRRTYSNEIPTNCKWCPFSHVLPCYPWTPESSKAVVLSNYVWLMDDHASTWAQECDFFSIMELCVCVCECVREWVFFSATIWKLRNLDIICVFGVSRIWRISKCWLWSFSAHKERWPKVSLQGVNGGMKSPRIKTVITHTAEMRQIT